MVRMDRLGLAMAQTLSLMVLTYLNLALPKGYERISTKSKPTEGEGEGEGGEGEGGEGREVVQDQPGGW